MCGRERKKKEKKKKSSRINQRPETKCSQKNVCFLSVRLFLKVRLSVAAIVEELGSPFQHREQISPAAAQETDSQMGETQGELHHLGSFLVSREPPSAAVVEHLHRAVTQETHSADVCVCV